MEKTSEKSTEKSPEKSPPIDDIEQGLFTSLAKLKKKFPDSTTKELKEALASSANVQVTHEKHKPRSFEKITANMKNDIWQSDLLDVRNIPKNGRFILTVVDVYSRFAWARPLKSKQAPVVAEAFASIIEAAGSAPNNLNRDKGSEFAGAFHALIEKHNIREWVSEPDDPRKNSIVERFNRTLRRLISRFISVEKTNKFIDRLQELMINYNRSYHTGIKAIPEEVYALRDYNHAQFEHIQQYVIPKMLEAKLKLITGSGNGPAPHLSDGTHVRHLKILGHKPFADKASERYTREVYTTKRDGKKYLLIRADNSQLQRRFARDELLVVSGKPESDQENEALLEREKAKKEHLAKRRFRKAGVEAVPADAVEKRVTRGAVLNLNRKAESIAADMKKYQKPTG